MYIEVTFPDDRTYTGDRSFGRRDVEEGIVKVTKWDDEILIEFEFVDSPQRGGSLALGPDLGRWLANALLAKADGAPQPTAASFKGDKVVQQV